MSIKILLADDSITIQKVVGIIFGGEDYTLTVVDNGKAAVEKARELNPDVLLIDALMPGMSGYEVCEAVRATPELASKPILLLTGSFEPFDETKAKNCGADDFLAKPFESQQIVTKVKELFDMGANRAGSAQPAAAPILEEEPFAPAFVEFEEETPAVSFTETPAATNDIWGAFTASEETTPPVAASQAPEELAADEDVFAMIGDESEADVAPAEAIKSPISEDIGSQWIPVEEETFAFEEEVVAPTPAPSFDTPEPVIEDDTFAMVTPSPEPPTFEIPAVPVPPVVVEPVPVAVQATEPEIAAPIEAAPVAMTEEQLRTALTSASKEVIERIVWEVVPDLAEIMIKEAIRKIKEGI